MVHLRNLAATSNTPGIANTIGKPQPMDRAAALGQPNPDRADIERIERMLRHCMVLARGAEVSFFELTDATEMLRKAKRELARIQSDASVDHVYNFFVTAYHVIDYVKEGGSVSREELQALRTDWMIQYCADVCNKAKHMRLTRRDDVTPVRFSGTVGGAPIGMLPLNATDERWVMWQDGTYVEMVSFARATVVRLEQFFIANKIPL
ncbi:hypothetical protein PPMP20_04385 [Paraburkholderia phymatum]|nr:hypothetical protein [Paraburkholderia phymatum]